MKQTIITAFPTFRRLPVAFLLTLIVMTGQGQTIPTDWFKTDTITIRGRIEGYDTERFGFTSMECYYNDIFEKNDATLILYIASDGTFCKKFKASHPIRQSFHAQDSKISFNEIPFFARPGETIDITIRINEQGKYECFYNSGSSHDVERWLKAPLNMFAMFRPLHHDFIGTPKEMRPVVEQIRRDVLLHIDSIAHNEHFTPLEKQLAQAEADLEYGYAIMDYFMYREHRSVKQNIRDGKYYTEILDSIAEKDTRQIENYMLLQCINADNPLLLCLEHTYPFINRLQYARPVQSIMYDNQNVTEAEKLHGFYTATRTMLRTAQNTLLAQACCYRAMLDGFNSWRSRRDNFLTWLTKHPEVPDSIGQKRLTAIEGVEEIFPTYLATFTHPYLHAKAQDFYDEQMAITEISSPLPEVPMADLIRSLCAKYPGKILIIDFWGMSCGPCRSAIQSSKQKRAEIAKRDDVKLVFIAGERTTEGSDAYRKYVAEWLADEETVCVTNADFTRLQELFRFNGIPHYETITPDCRRVRDDLQVQGFYNFDYEMKRLKEKLK